MANRISDYPIPIVFKTILLKKSSGQMVIHGKGYEKMLYFIQGKFEYAVSNLNQERLARVILLKGFLNQRQLDELGSWPESGDAERMGRKLVQNGILTQKQVYECLISRVKIIAASTFNLMEGEWDFIRGTMEIPGGLTFHIPLARIIMEGVKDITDFRFYKNLLYPYTLHAGKLPESLKQLLTPFSLQFFSTIVPLSGRMTSEVIDRMVMPEDIFLRELVMFYLLNALEFRETEESKSDTETMIAIQVGPIKRKATESDMADTSQTKKSRIPAASGEEKKVPAQAAWSPSAPKHGKTRPPNSSAKNHKPGETGEIIELLPEAEKREEPHKREKTGPPSRTKASPLHLSREEPMDQPKVEKERDRYSISDVFQVTPAPEPLDGEKTQPPEPASAAEQGVIVPDMFELVSQPELSVEMGPTSPAGSSEEESTAVHKKGRTQPPSPGEASPEREFGIPIEFEIELKSASPSDKYKSEPAASASEEIIEAPRHGKIPSQAPVTAGTLNPKEVYKKALTLYENKKYREAAMLLAPSVRPTTSPSSHIFLLGLCQAKVPEYKKEAERHFKSVAEKEPWNADPHYALGELYRSEGLMQKAEASFRMALEINKDHTLAGMAISEIGGQKKKKLPFSGSHKK